MTKTEEKYIFERFQETYKNMPKGIPDFSDKPDIIFTSENSDVIGIELTECIYDQNMMGKSEFQIKFNNDVVEKLAGYIPFKFTLDIELDNEFPIKQNQRKLVIDKLIKFCNEEFINLKSYESIRYENLDIEWTNLSMIIKDSILALGYRKLPKGILNLCMTRNDNLKKSTHFESKFGIVPDFTDKELNRILSKKHEALLKYNNCDQQWLLIVEGWDFYSYIGDVNIKNEIITNFDKIFMYRRLTSEIIIIK
ncbi:hypothetical protein AB670_01634 [Chryseobacterium sp. MOF25P]|uniref:hypothetical protein n=1 Tax=unclassified Chryseobacterium TaxID=2593645 RepID=UPI000804CB15|nr:MULTISPECIES: hypothetical protein [unclassified Chryseobacterium]OBW41983.1 hypothetical protein AB670_01634 [Chryseobacterium sp. MOF25P]OBW47217.1 hypothetical protein AB671_00646 [Chryseobacterium sp. BGARF1]